MGLNARRSLDPAHALFVADLRHRLNLEKSRAAPD